MKKFIISILSICLLAIPINTSANTKDTASSDSAIINEYLLDAGYPQYIIDILDDNDKATIYESKYRFQTVQKTSGILSDKYQIEFQYDDNNKIKLDNKNQEQFNQLLKDDKEIAKIMYYNDYNKKIDDANLIKYDSEPCTDSNEPKTISTINNLNNENFDQSLSEKKSLLEGEINNYYDQNIEQINSIKVMDIATASSTWENYTSYIVVSHLGSQYSLYEKLLFYHWDWTYSPADTLTDKAALAWSGDYQCDSTTIRWTYKPYARECEYDPYMSCYFPTGNSGYYQWSGTDYNDYNPGCGIGKDIDRYAWYSYASTPSCRWFIYRHTGSLQAEVAKYYYLSPQNERSSVVGQYWNKYIILASGNFTFSPSGPGISLSYSANYRKGQDAAQVFDILYTTPK